MWYVYVLSGHDPKKIYIGMTNDLKRRLMEHRAGGTQTTSRMKNVELVYYEASRSKKDAIVREKQLKSGFGRGFIKKRIANDITPL